MYAIGGCDSWTCLNTVERYDREAAAWKPIAPLITSRRGCGVAVFNQKIYCIAGHDGSRSLNSVEIYDPETKTWTQGPALNQARANVGVAVIGSRLYACGGFTGKTFLSTIEFLDLNMGADEWFVFESGGGELNAANSEPSLSEGRENGNIEHSLSKCSLLSDEPLVEVEEAIANDNAELDDNTDEVD